MNIIYIFLIISIIVLVGFSFVCKSYQKRLSEVMYTNTFTVPIDLLEKVEKNDDGFDIPEIISSYIVEETNK